MQIIKKYGPAIVVVIAVVSLIVSIQQLRVAKGKKKCGCSEMEPL